MFQSLKDMFAVEAPVDFNEILANGGKIIDVRTYGEFSSGHVNGSVNIPLQNLQNEVQDLDTDQPYILVCASGNRSGSAKRMMENMGFTNIYNGGGWMQLQGQLN